MGMGLPEQEDSRTELCWRSVRSACWWRACQGRPERFPEELVRCLCGTSGKQDEQRFQVQLASVQGHQMVVSPDTCVLGQGLPSTRHELPGR